MDERNDLRGPLDGLRVIDWTMSQFGSVSTMMLADTGTEVIQVESRRQVDRSGWHRFNASQ